MKKYDIEQIEKNLDLLSEIAEDLKKIMYGKYTYYARLTGVSKQAIYGFCKEKTDKYGHIKKFKTTTLIEIYKKVYEDEEKKKMPGVQIKRA